MMSANPHRPTWGLALLILIPLWACPETPHSRPNPPILALPTEAPKAPPAATKAPAAPDPQALLRAFESKRSGVWMQVQGRVTRTLADDLKGDRHQRFLIQVGPLSVLVAHNIDLAPRIPLKVADTVQLRGRYEYNDKGGVLHWTHKDPQGKKQGGYVELNGQRFR